MSDNKNVNVIPNGINTPLVAGLEYIALQQNMTFDTTTQAINLQRTQNLYRLVIDENTFINGIYIVDLRVRNKRYNVVIAASGQTKTALSDNVNTVNILSLMNEDPSIVDFRSATLYSNSQNSKIALILELEAIGNSWDDVTANVTGITATGRITPSASTYQYTTLLSQKKLGTKNSVEVKDDSAGVNIDLNSISTASVIYANPATDLSAPENDKVGMCITFMGTDSNTIASQLFLSITNRAYIRLKQSVYSMWTELSTGDKYPKLVAAGARSGTFSSTATTVTIDSSIDLSSGRYSVFLTPESSNISVPDVTPVSLSNGSFGIVATLNGQPWTGKINWNILENQKKTDVGTVVIQSGILENNLFIEKNSVDEGQLARFILNTTNTVNGTSVPYIISGIQQADIDLPLSGYCIINNNIGIIDIPVIQDFLPENRETMTLTLPTFNNASKSMFINDISGTPSYTAFVAKNADGSSPIKSISEGESAYLILQTKYIADGSQFTFSAVDSADIANYVDFASAKNIQANIISVPFTITSSNLNYTGDRSLSLNALFSGVQVATTTITVIDSIWRGEAWYSSDINGVNRITEANEGTVVYFVCRLPSTASIGEAFKPVITSTGAAGQITPGQDIDITNSSLTAQVYDGSTYILKQRIQILADLKTEGDELLTMSWTKVSDSSLVGDASRPLMIKDTSITPIKTINLDGYASYLDVYKLAISQFGAQNEVWTVNVNLTGNTAVSGYSTDLPAINTAGFLSGTIVNVNFLGTGGIYGKGGAGAFPYKNRKGGDGGALANVPSGVTLNLILSADCLVGSGGGGGDGISINGHYIGGGGAIGAGEAGEKYKPTMDSNGNITGYPDVEDISKHHSGTAATLASVGAGGSYTYTNPSTSATTTYTAGSGGQLGLNGSTNPNATIGAGSRGRIKTGTGVMTINAKGTNVIAEGVYSGVTIRGDFVGF